ncbi:MAG TPA: thiazole synthase [Fibrobacteria bacterium]|nr:thiazole synthase [Fibrobacteria bacterium]
MDTSDTPQDRPFVIAGKTYTSRLLVGTGKYDNHEIMAEALEASGTQIVTVALGRVDLSAPKGKGIFDAIDPSKYTILPNTAGAFNVQDALRIARLSRSMGWKLLKLEVLFDQKTLLPDPIGTLEAARLLKDEGFDLMIYTNDDPVLAQLLDRLEPAAIMPAGGPIGSGQGVLNPANIRIILESVKAPVLIDAGLGSASDVAEAMELGVDGVLLNTPIAKAKDPVRMARAMKAACEAGRDSYLAVRIPRKLYGSASSPLEGLTPPRRPTA